MNGFGQAERREVVAFAQRLAARGWVANHDGNVTVRLGDGAGSGFLATPSGVGKAEVTADMLVVVDAQGKVTSGKRKVFSEIGLHLAVYQARPDVRAVLHAHPPTATGLAVAGSRLLAEPFLHEAVVSLGPGVPLVPAAMPGRTAEQALAPYLWDHDAVLLGNHGVLSWGPDLLTAFYRLELVEHLARIALVAVQAGGIRPLGATEIAQLLEARRKAGLGPEARGPRPASATAAPPPPEPVATRPVTAHVIPSVDPEVARIISQEVARALTSGRGGR